MKHRLDIFAGPRALRVLAERGLRAADIDVVVAASGGPKWIVLHGLDRAILEGALGSFAEVAHLIGSSSGAWRMACWAQADPAAALDRLAQAYIGQRYPPRPPISLVSRTCEGIVSHLLGATGAADIVASPRFRLHVLTAACRGLMASDDRKRLLAGLIAASLCNAVSRPTLGWWMTRTIFHAAGDCSPFTHLDDLPTRHVPLTVENLPAALLATGSIPLLAEGVDIADAPDGRHRDGALTDYHPCFDFGRGEGLVLYPHFFPAVTAGWLDRFAPLRRPRSTHFDRVVLLAPSPSFVASLPGRKIPDRNDFYHVPEGQRIRRWEAVRDASTALGEELAELVASGQVARRARPFPY